MEILLQLKGKVLSITFGKNTDWFDRYHWFSVAILVFDNNMQAVDGRILFCW